MASARNRARSGFGVATVGNGTMLAFLAADHAMEVAFHAAALANGGSCEGMNPVFYAAYVRDGDGNGNKLCAFVRK